MREHQAIVRNNRRVRNSDFGRSSPSTLPRQMTSVGSFPRHIISIVVRSITQKEIANFPRVIFFTNSPNKPSLYRDWTHPPFQPARRAPFSNLATPASCRIFICRPSWLAQSSAPRRPGGRVIATDTATARAGALQRLSSFAPGGFPSSPMFAVCFPRRAAPEPPGPGGPPGPREEDDGMDFPSSQPPASEFRGAAEG